MRRPRLCAIVVLMLAPTLPARAQTAAPADGVQAAAAAAGTESQPPAAPNQPTPAQEPMNPTQEIAKETPEGHALTAGPTEIRIGGYVGITGLYRSTSNGGGIGTRFAAIPYDDTLDGNLSEVRLSAQASRLSVRVNAAPAPDRATLAGYFEMDFNGSSPGTVAVTSTGVGFRLRHAFGEGQFRGGRLIFAAGQAFTLMAPPRSQISIWPSDYQLSQAIDANYLAGLVWGRTPQVRLTYRPSASFNWAVSVENPEQQIGNSLVKLPACCVDDLEAQYNTGSDELSVANLMPDIVSRAAFNKGDLFHLDAGGVFRVFRHVLAPYDQSVKKAAGGVTVNARLRSPGDGSLIGQMSYGAGLGRYIGGLVPDATVTADGEIHPIRTFSWVTGVEQGPRHFLSLAAYYSGVRADASYSLDTDGTFIGFGYPGAPNSNNQRIDEVTGVVAWQAWRLAGRGSVQWNTQISWVNRSPQSQGAGPPSASAILFFTQIRYNLP
jgi:hypothetical protein